MSEASPRNSSRKTWLITGLIMLVVAASGYYLWSNRSLFTGGGTYETSTAALGTLTSSVGATGTVRAGQSAKLLWNSSGRVGTVNVQIGDKVETDQILATLSDSSVPQNIILAKADILSAQKELDTLLQSDLNVAQAMQNLANAKQAVEDAQDSYNFLTQKRVPNEVIGDTSDEIDAAKAQLKRLEFFYNLFYANRPDGSTDKAIMIVQLTNSKENIANLTAKYNWYSSQASALEIEKSLADLNLAKAKQEDAQRAMDRLKNGTNLDDITAAKARVAAAQAVLDRAQITSPFNGTVTESLPLPGDYVSTNQSAFRVDDLSTLMVDLQISEVDINNVVVDQQVTIELDALPDKVYQGIVSRVNLSAKAGQGGINFLVSVTLTDADELVKPGMSAAITIAVKQVNDALLVPNQAIRMVAGEHTVYILKDDQPVPVNVRLGASANNTSQVVGGNLKAGDLIILNPPSSATNMPVIPVK